MIDFLLLSADDDQLLQFLANHHVVSGSRWCEQCFESCRRDVGRKLFICDKRHTSVDAHSRRRSWRCRYSRSMFADTWFAHVRLSVRDVCRLNCMWLVLPFPRQNFIMREIGVSSHSVVDWSSFCREVCMFWLEQRCEVLGGPGIVVEIDEAKIGRRKYNRGRWVNGNWVFGGIERGTGRCFIVPVPNRGAVTLLGVIKKWIRPGTTIISDCWKAYDCLSSEGFIHQTVNHSQNFVDPCTRSHTQNIERVWREVRGNIPRFGRREGHMVGYLAEFLFKQKFSDHRDRVHAFFSAVGQLYPPSF